MAPKGGGTARGGAGRLGLTPTETQRRSGRPEDGGVGTAKTVKRPPQQPTQRANDWAPLTHKRHIPPHPAQPRHPNDTSRSTGRSGRQNAATQRSMRREEWVTVQGPVKKQRPDGMSMHVA